MKIKTVSGSAMAAAAASLIISGAVLAPTTAGAAAAGKCSGINACKGQGTCKTLFNQCKGQNTCKGQGFSMMSKAECAKAGGVFAKG